MVLVDKDSLVVMWVCDEPIKCNKTGDLIKSKQEFWAHCTDRKISHKGPYTNVGNYKHSVVKRLGWNLQKRCL